MINNNNNLIIIIIIFERLKLPQQIIHCWKVNLSESAIYFKYRKNILVSRFY